MDFIPFIEINTRINKIIRLIIMFLVCSDFGVIVLLNSFLNPPIAHLTNAPIYSNNKAFISK